jgi:hypothetical protein
MFMAVFMCIHQLSIEQLYTQPNKLVFIKQQQTMAFWLMAP